MIVDAFQIAPLGNEVRSDCRYEEGRIGKAVSTDHRLAVVQNAAAGGFEEWEAEGTSASNRLDSSAGVSIKSTVSLQLAIAVAAASPDSRMEKGKPVQEKSAWPQQPVISIRVSEALRSRLERLKELLSKKSGESVTTSEVAKQLLESARENRLEVAELLADATAALAGAQRKVEAGLSLSRAEWIIVAHYAQLGVESSIADPVSP